MVNYCVAVDCKNSSDKCSKVSFHRLPYKREIRGKWIHALRRKHWYPEEGGDYRVCSDHFLPSDYLEFTGVERKHLKKGVVPSVFPTFPVQPESPAKKRRKVVVIEALPETITIKEEPSEEDPDLKAKTNDIAKEHGYAYPNNKDWLRGRCEELKARVELLQKNNAMLRKRTERTLDSNKKLVEAIDDLKEQGLIKTESAAILKNFQGENLDLVKQLLNKKSKTGAYSEEVKEFSCMLYCHSPEAYDFLRTTFALPSASTLRTWLGRK